MSTEIKSNRYDEIRVLFGFPPTDFRSRLYLDALKTRYDETLKIEPLDRNMVQLQKKFYSGGDPTDESIHDEWTTFGNNLYISIQTLITNKSTEYNEAKEIIKNNGGFANYGTDKHFNQEIIKNHFLIEKYTEDITDKPDEWSALTDIKLNNLIQTYLFKNINIRSPLVASSNYFSINVNKLLTQLLLEAYAKSHKSSGADKFWEDDKDLKNSYYRLDGDRSKLYTTDENGNKVDVSLYPGSDAYNKLQKEKCLGTGFTGDATTTCTEYITKCINGNSTDIKKCKDFMQNPNFWRVVPEEVNQMNPTVAETTLNSFGFEIIVNSSNLKEFEDVGSWSKKLNSRGLTDIEVKNINDNFKLKQYLTLLVTKINSNPAILNKQYNASHMYDPVDHTNRFTSWSLALRGLRPRVIIKDTKDKINIIRQSSLLNNSLLNLRTIVNNRVSFIPGSGLVIGGVPIPFFSTGMTGGASFQLIPSVNTNQNEIREHYPVIKGLLYAAEKTLQSKGKNIHEDTKKQIELHLENFRKSEDKLIRSIKYADRYIDLLNIYKTYDSNDVLTMDHLKSFVEAREGYFDKTMGKQNNLLNAIESLLTTVNEKLN